VRSVPSSTVLTTTINECRMRRACGRRGDDQTWGIRLTAPPLGSAFTGVIVGSRSDGMMRYRGWLTAIAKPVRPFVHSRFDDNVPNVWSRQQLHLRSQLYVCCFNTHTGCWVHRLRRQYCTCAICSRAVCKRGDWKCGSGKCDTVNIAGVEKYTYEKSNRE